MISFLRGEILKLSREPAQAVILAGGVGYDVLLPAHVQQSLVNEGVGIGSEVDLEIHYHVTERQPRPLLVGFMYVEEREFFEKLLEVEGIGPTKAASAMVLPVATIARAIETEDMRVLTRLPGVGTRGAQKMVAALKGKVGATAMLDLDGAAAGGARTAPGDPRSEAIEALVGLGYRQSEAQDRVDGALRRKPEAGGDVSELMREVFRGQVPQQ
jgi:Holliday junction DNA helicase RuvA